MKLGSLLVMISLLFTTACRTSGFDGSSAKSHEGGLTDEEYYVKAEIFLRFTRCVGQHNIRREGDKVTIHAKGGEAISPPLTQCIEPLKMYPTMWDIVQADDSDVIIKIRKATSVEIATEFLNEHSEDTCVTKSQMTSRGLELTLGENQDAHCKDSLSNFALYFKIIERSDTKLVLSAESNNFNCSNEDKSITVSHFKDFRIQSAGELFDPISYAYYAKKVANGNVEQIKLDHCDFSVKVINYAVWEGKIACNSTTKNIQHELNFSAINLQSTLKVDGQESPTTCTFMPEHDDI
ncbi:MAG: hypothetical protein AB7T49_17870 [Oligoflexales bacterium]